LFFIVGGLVTMVGRRKTINDAWNLIQTPGSQRSKFDKERTLRLSLSA